MKKAIVTGAYGIIGKAIAKGMAEFGYDLFLVGRDTERLFQLHKEIRFSYPDCHCKTFAIDVSSKKEVFDFATRINEEIHILVNNAAAAPRTRMETREGIEVQWATNVLGYFWMMKAFIDNLLLSENPRIVNVASYWAGGLDLSDPEFKHRKYNNDLAYRQSKQANRQLTYAFAEKYKDQICVNTCHPGDANSKLSNDLGFGGSESAKKAAETPLILATTDMGIEYSGEYFEYGKKSTCRFKDDKKEINALFSLCCNY